MSDIGTAALGIGTGIITNTINQAMGLNQAENLQNLSIAGQKELADYNYNKQLELFEATGLKGQARQAREAGLNPAILYAKGGAGGQTNTSVPSISAQSGQRMDTVAGMEITNRLALQEATIKNLMANARKTEVEANKIEGVDTANTEANTNYTNLKSAEQEFNNEIAKVNAEIAKDTQTDHTVEIQANARAAVARMESAEAKADIDQDTIDDEIYRIGQESIGSMLKNQATIAGTKLTQRQTSAITEQLTQGFMQILINRRNALANEKNADTNVLDQINKSQYNSESIRNLFNASAKTLLLILISGSSELRRTKRKQIRQHSFAIRITSRKTPPL